MNDDDGWDIDQEFDDDDLPSLLTEEGRDKWGEILLQQDDEGPDGNGWAKAITVTDGENMVIRFKFPDGTEEVFDLIVRRSIAVVNANDGESN